MCLQRNAGKVHSGHLAAVALNRLDRTLTRPRDLNINLVIKLFRSLMNPRVRGKEVNVGEGTKMEKRREKTQN
jgi:hypothetical protein